MASDSFLCDGACVVRSLLDAGEVALLEQAVERNIAEPSERAIEGGGDAGSGRFFEDFRTPWHQDQPYYNIDGFQTASFWIPLDPVPRESTLEFVAGSHASRTWYMPRSCEPAVSRARRGARPRRSARPSALPAALAERAQLDSSSRAVTTGRDSGAGWS
jgi:hypothetical protein